MNRDEILEKLSAMGYYGYCDMEDKSIDDLTINQLKDYLAEKQEEMEEEDK